MKRSGGIIQDLILHSEYADIGKRQPITEVAGNSRVLIENHQCILQYTTQCICIKVSFGCIRINGSKLKLAQMTAARVVICGSIETVQFCKKEACGRK